MGEKIIGLRQLSIFSRGVGGREGGRYRFVARDTASREKRDALVPRVEAATVDSSSSTPFREWLHVRRAKGVGNIPVEPRRKFLVSRGKFVPYSLLFPSLFSPPFRRVKPLRALYPMSTRLSVFPPFFLLLSSSSPPFSHLLRRISCSFLAGFSRFGESSVGISGESSRFERLAD